MNIDYLYSIIHLYLSRELEHKKTILNIKKMDDLVEFGFNMNKDEEEKTTFVIPYEEYGKHIYDLLKVYKEDLIIIDEKYSLDKTKTNCDYSVLFKSGRTISFTGFSVIEMNNVRNVLYDIKINSNEVRLDTSEEKEMAYKPRLRLQQAGFSSYATLFFITIFFLFIFVGSLFVFKFFIK